MTPYRGMAIKILPDAKVIKLPRLTTIAALLLMVKEHVEKLKDEVKLTMKKKDVAFAESDHAIAHLRGGGGGKATFSWINPAKLFKLTQGPSAKKITTGEFFKCVSVKTEKLKELLSPEEIEKITDTFTAKAGEAKLYTEMKPNAQVDFDVIEAAVQDAVSQLTAQS